MRKWPAATRVTRGMSTRSQWHPTPSSWTSIQREVKLVHPGTSPGHGSSGGNDYIVRMQAASRTGEHRIVADALVAPSFGDMPRRRKRQHSLLVKVARCEAFANRWATSSLPSVATVVGMMLV